MPSFQQILPDVFQWTDTCNVYVVRHGDAALLIDLGDGSVLDHLGEIGVRTVEWVLFTHHHREQCQGGARLAGTGIKVAASLIEKPLLETVLHRMQGNQTHAAQVLGLNRNTLRKKMQAHGIK